MRRARLVLGVLIIVAIGLITLDYKDSGGSAAHSVGGRLFGPAEHLAGSVTGWFRGGSAEITALQKQNDQLRAELSQARVRKAESAQLASMLGVAGRNKVVSASVIAAGGAYSDTVTISVGSSSGIAPNETVLNGDGLVGTVTAVTSSTATVQLASDSAATVGVRLVGSGKIGALTGTATSFSGSAQLRLTVFDSTASLKPGDELVTFGSVGGRPYVPGIPVGTIVSVTTEPGSLTPTALVQPLVDFSALGVVGVVVSR